MMTLFQSTHPTRECDQFFNRFLDRIVKFQSTHPTRECDSGIRHTDLLTGISIHAPYKRVRRWLLRCLIHNCQFQSTHPTRECDRCGCAKRWLAGMNFNPRTLQESATAIYSKKITFSQYIGLKILIRNKKYPSLK